MKQHDKPVLRFREGVRTEGRFIRQRGEPGRFAIINLEVEPIPSGFEFSWEVDADLVPANYADAVLAGVNGVLDRLGLICAQTRIRVVGGAYHEVDSCVMAYTAAASIAFQEAIDFAGSTDC